MNEKCKVGAACRPAVESYSTYEPILLKTVVRRLRSDECQDCGIQND
jgi:hypothetical protein